MATRRKIAKKTVSSRPRGGVKRIAVIGNYVPRRCGIATFTAGLCEALATEAAKAHVAVIAMNDRPEGYDYPPRVEYEVNADRLEDYYSAFHFIQTGAFDLVCVQHEYGIFGGPTGSHLLALLRQLRIPIVVTLHTVKKRPEENERRVLAELARLADRLVVMSPRSAQLLEEAFGVDQERIRLIPHGVPDVPLVDPEERKTAIGADGRRVILTFGLLSPGKGIEYMIEAMPAIVENHRDVLYIVPGETHPNIRRYAGETYRTKLDQLARERGVEKHVVLKNEFLGLRKLFQYLSAADLYVTPYLNQDQAVSGTLAYAIGAGKPVVSTTYWYALDMLAKGRGRLVPPRDAESLAWACVDLLDNDAERNAMARRCHKFSRNMVWPKVAKEYLNLFGEVVREHRTRPEPVLMVTTPEGSELGLEEAKPEVLGELPPVNFEHLKRLTDDFGIIQHARYTVPDRRRGYTTDDNARALIAAVLGRYVAPDDPAPQILATRYLSFLDLAFNPRTGRFRNFLGYNRAWLEAGGSEDCHGRALWALGTAMAMDQDPGRRRLAADLFCEALPVLEGFTSLRSLAFGLLGLDAYLKRDANGQVQRIWEAVAGRLYEPFHTNATADWPWPEPVVTYANARLPHALIRSGEALEDRKMVAKGLESLKWLIEIQRNPNGWFSPVGNHGWYERGGGKARFDQQPIEAHAMVEACLDAHEMTAEPEWLEAAQSAFKWFQGRNDILMPLYDPRSGGCRDGLHPDRANENQGAESTLAWLLSLLRIHLRRGAGEPERAERKRAVPAAADPPRPWGFSGRPQKGKS